MNISRYLYQRTRFHQSRLRRRRRTFGGASRRRPTSLQGIGRGRVRLAELRTSPLLLIIIGNASANQYSALSTGAYIFLALILAYIFLAQTHIVGRARSE